MVPSLTHNQQRTTNYLLQSKSSRPDVTASRCQATGGADEVKRSPIYLDNPTNFQRCACSTPSQQCSCVKRLCFTLRVSLPRILCIEPTIHEDQGYFSISSYRNSLQELSITSLLSGSSAGLLTSPDLRDVRKCWFPSR